MVKKLSKPVKKSKASIAREGNLKKAENPEELYELIKPQLENLVQECNWAFYMDPRGQVLGVEEIAKGAVDHVELNPRELFRPAIELAASFVIMAHNHPSGKTDPSNDDWGLTRRMVEAGEIIGIPVADHLVVSKDGFTSMQQKNPHAFIATGSMLSALLGGM